MADTPETKDDNAADLLAPPGPPPRPWPYILVGLGGAIALAIAAGILIRFLMLSRPVDLVPATDALADHLTEVLTAALVPEHGIKRGAVQPREETTCRWHEYDFEVELPAAMSVQGTRDLLIKGMAERQARVSREDPLEFSIGPYAFARVAFHGGSDTPGEAAPGKSEPGHATEEPADTETIEREELRLASITIALKAAKALRTAGAPAASIVLGDAVEEESERAVWTRSRIQLADWTPPNVDALVSAIVTAVGPDGAQTARSADNEILVTLGGNPVVEISLAGESPATQMPAPSTASETGKEDLREGVQGLVAAARDGLADAGVPRDAIVLLPERATEDSAAVWTLAHMKVAGGTTIAPETLLAAILKRAGGPPAEGSVDASAGPPELHLRLKSRLVLIVELQPRDEEKPTEIAPDEGEREGERGVAPGDPKNPKVAIILDDGGNNRSVAEEVLKLDPALTLSILPHTEFGPEIAAEGAKKNFEIMLHMPMEPLGEAARDKGLLKVGMSEEEITRLTEEAVAEVPGIVGINNHKGSKFTSDAASMAMFFRAVKGMPYYFVDSVTSGKSRAYMEAKAAGIRTAKRSVFLDDKADAAYISKQFAILRSVAKKTGSAIAIGHFRPKTVAVLPKELATLKKEGITLVRASELVQ